MSKLHTVWTSTRCYKTTASRIKISLKAIAVPFTHSYYVGNTINVNASAVLICSFESGANAGQLFEVEFSSLLQKTLMWSSFYKGILWLRTFHSVCFTKVLLFKNCFSIDVKRLLFLVEIKLWKGFNEIKTTLFVECLA